MHCTLVKEKIFDEFSEIDAVCIGEGEFPLKELSYRLDKNENYLSTQSFYFKTDNGIIKNPILPLKDIDTLAFPEYSLFNYEKILAESGHCFPMMLARGCPFNCNYCCNHVIRNVYPNKNNYVRIPSVDHSIKIIKNNLTLYPKTQKIIFADDTFTLRKSWLFEFCEAYKKEIDLPFLCNARVETIDDQVAKCLKSAGCVSIDFGVESGNEWLRKYILNRKHSNKQIKKAFNITKKNAIKSFSFNMVGLPFETAEMAKDTLKLNLEIQPNFGKCFYFYPYPGSTLYKLCLDHGLLLNNTESVSGYLEAPCIKETFMSHAEIKKQFELLNLFFFTRLLLSKWAILPILEKLLMKIVFALRKPIFPLLDPTSGNKTIMSLRNKMREFAMIYLR